MAIKQLRLGSGEDIIQYDDVDYDSAIETDQPIKAGTPIDPNDVLRKTDMPTIAAGGLGNNKIVETDGAGDLDSVDDLTNYIAGTANRITVTTDGDGTVTITIPNTPQVVGALLSSLTASRLLASNGTKNLVSVASLSSWIAGTANEITVTNDGDGSVTISGAGSETDFTVITAIQAGGIGAIGFQYKTRALTLNSGIISTVGAESGWNDI